MTLTMSEKRILDICAKGLFDLNEIAYKSCSTYAENELERLIKKGLIEKVPDPAKYSDFVYSLTNEGRNLIHETRRYLYSCQ